MPFHTKTEPVRFTGATLEANTYVFIHGSSALLFDAVDSAELLPYLEAAGVKYITILLTHEHFDHIIGLGRLREMFACKVIASAECGKRMQSPRTNLSLVADAVFSMQTSAGEPKTLQPFSAAGADATLADDCVLTWQGHSIRCRCLGGHSPGSVCYIMDDTLLFSGDELLPIPVLTRLPGGSTERYRAQDMPWFKSIQSGISQVFPGHGQPGNMQDMININLL